MRKSLTDAPPSTPKKKIADAFHALTDMVSDIMTLATVSFALRPPSPKFPNGYGKIESLGSLGVSSLLLLGGMAMGMLPRLPVISRG